MQASCMFSIFFSFAETSTYLKVFVLGHNIFYLRRMAECNFQFVDCLFHK